MRPCRYCGGPAEAWVCRSTWKGCQGKAKGAYWIEKIPGRGKRLFWLFTRPAHRFTPKHQGPYTPDDLRERVSELRGKHYRRAIR